MGVAIGMVYSNDESVAKSVATGYATYFSRSRNKLWTKGEESGNLQVLQKISFDCDADALKFTVVQLGKEDSKVGPAFCHQNQYSCFDNYGNFGTLKKNSGLSGLFRLICERKRVFDKEKAEFNATKDLEAKSDAEKVKLSYTQRLFHSETLLQKKLLEESQELIEAVADVSQALGSSSETMKGASEQSSVAELVQHVNAEAADLLYFALVGLAAGKGDLANVTRELDLRHLKVKRRPGNAKESRTKKAIDILDKVLT